MAIPPQLIFEGQEKEFQFRDKFMMPLLVRLGFGIVVNYHGQREFGKDVIFGDIDRFGHVIYFGMQLKYNPSISISDSHALIQDAEQATNNPFRHPHSGREEYISCFYVANAGNISDSGRDNFFNTLARRGIRDARLLDGNALLLLDKTASINRNADVQERLTGLVQEVRVNRNINSDIVSGSQAFVNEKGPFPGLRFRNTASGNYLNAPFPIPNLPTNIVDRYWQLARIINYLVDSIDGPVSSQGFRIHRVEGIKELAPQMLSQGAIIEAAAVILLNQLSSTKLL